MQFSRRTNCDLVILCLLPLLLLGVIFLVPVQPVRIALGLPTLAFLPGYALLAALFPRRDDLRGAERTALSFGLSVAIVPLVGLFLNYTPWGGRLGPVLVVLAAFILACCAVAHHRRSRLSSWRRFRPRFEVGLLRPRNWGWLSALLAVGLVLSSGAAVAALGYAIAVPRASEPFTEFYILGPGGSAEGYPREVSAGEPIPVTIGVVNHEGSAVAYRIERVGETGAEHIASPQLGDGETWEQGHTFSLGEPGEERQVTFLLYREADQTPYRSLHLWVSVTEK